MRSKAPLVWIGRLLQGMHACTPRSATRLAWPVKRSMIAFVPRLSRRPPVCCVQQSGLFAWRMSLSGEPFALVQEAARLTCRFEEIRDGACHKANRGFQAALRFTRHVGSTRREAIRGAPETVRTSDPCLRRAVLYPAELRARGSRDSISATCAARPGEPAGHRAAFIIRRFCAERPCAEPAPSVIARGMHERRSIHQH